jgi:hypothetical protein
MKKIITFLSILGVVLFSSCEGPQGPPGYDGFDGQDGQDGLIAEVFEVTNVSFTSTNDYNPIIDLNPSILSSDMVLLYRLAGIDNGQDVWKLTPETYYFSDGTLNFGYNYNFTKNDVSIYLDGNSLSTVPNEFRINQTFRIVIIPGYLTSKSTVKPDYSDYNAVIKKYNIDDSNIKKIN